MAPTDTKTWSRPESIEIQSRPRLYITKKNNNKTDNKKTMNQ